MAGKLIAEEGLLKGLEFPLEGGNQWLLGRDTESCQILLEDPDVVPVHLLIKSQKNNFEVEAMADAPVEINGEAISENAKIKDGDKIRIGSTIFRFEEEAIPMEEETKDTDIEETADKGGNFTPTPGASAYNSTTAPPDTHPSEGYAAIRPHVTFEGLESEAQESQPEKEMDTIFDHAKEDGDDVLAEVNFDLVETGRWLLKVIGGPNNGAEFYMQASSNYLIGTDPNTCDIVFHDTSVSRQHARVTISDEETLVIEDLKSRNGIIVDGKRIEGREVLQPNLVVTLGTTSFIIFDREGEMQTVISPMLPSIVKVLQKEEEKKDEKTAEMKAAELAAATAAAVPEEPPPKKMSVLGSFFFIACMTGLVLLVGYGTLQLFRSEPVEIQETVDQQGIVHQAISPYSDVQFSYTPATGRLFLTGHVLNASEKNQLINNIQALGFVKNIDEKNVIIDEYYTREINPALSRNKKWRGVTIQTPKPGQFALTGYLQSRDDAERLSEFISTNFPYLDRLENRVVVEEDVTKSIENQLQRVGIRDVKVAMSGGEISLRGGIPTGKEVEYNRIVSDARAIPGVSRVSSTVNELPAEATLVNISDKYKVSGGANQGGVSTSVVINGRIITRGDSLDGMTVTSIKSNTIFLEKDGIKYRIDY